MNETLDSRDKSLRPLLREAVGVLFSEELLKKLISAEDKMTENREYLSILHQRKIISDIEFLEKINICFMAFIDDATELLGEDGCRSIYNYVRGEKINLIKTNEQNEQISDLVRKNSQLYKENNRLKASLHNFQSSIKNTDEAYTLAKYLHSKNINKGKACSIPSINFSIPSSSSDEERHISDFYLLSINKGKVISIPSINFNTSSSLGETHH